MALFGATEDEGTGIARVVDDLPRTTVQQLGPDQFPLVHTAAQAAREQEPLRMELLDHRQTGSRLLKGLEKQTYRVLHLSIRVANDTILHVVHKADGHHLLELSAAGGGGGATAQGRPEYL